MSLKLLVNNKDIWDAFNKELDIPKGDVITSTNVFQHTKNI